MSVDEAEVRQTGLQHDRRWMLADMAGNFISQRTYSEMALLQVDIVGQSLVVTHKKGLMPALTIPLEATTQREVLVNIWEDVCTALQVSSHANDWFTNALRMPVQLVHMPDTTKRPVDTNYANNNEIVSFADAFPILMIGQSSLDDLNTRLPEPMLMNRFRPNFVFRGGPPYFEDTIKTFSIRNITFSAVKPCARCVLTTVNQEDATKGGEPLKTLATYRTIGNKVMFGQNLLYKGAGKVKVGDKLIV